MVVRTDDAVPPWVDRIGVRQQLMAPGQRSPVKDGPEIVSTDRIGIDQRARILVLRPV